MFQFFEIGANESIFLKNIQVQVSIDWVLGLFVPYLQSISPCLKGVMNGISDDGSRSLLLSL